MDGWIRQRLANHWQQNKKDVEGGSENGAAETLLLGAWTTAGVRIAAVDLPDQVVENLMHIDLLLGRSLEGKSTFYYSNLINRKCTSVKALLNCRARFSPCSLPTTRSSSRSHLFPTRIMGTSKLGKDKLLFSFTDNFQQNKHRRCP
jgi:hypothetical protein